MISPCYKCADRTARCHEKCERYAAHTAARRAADEGRRAAMRADNDVLAAKRAYRKAAT